MAKNDEVFKDYVNELMRYTNTVSTDGGTARIVPRNFEECSRLLEEMGELFGGEIEYDGEEIIVDFENYSLVDLC